MRIYSITFLSYFTKNQTVYLVLIQKTKNNSTFSNIYKYHKKRKNFLKIVNINISCV